MTGRKNVATAVSLAIVIVFCCAGLVGSAAADEPIAESAELSRSAFSILLGVIKEWLPVVGGLVVAAAGGFLTWRNAQIFRAKAPHIVVEHQVSHRSIGSQYVHIFVTAVLHNRSRVHIELLDGFASIQQIKPISDAGVEQLYRQVFVEKEHDNLQWPDLDSLRHRWDKDGLLVEPGETETEIFDFVVQRGVTSVAVSTYFYNSRTMGKIPDGTELVEIRRRKKRFRRWLTEKGPIGWGRTTVYDIIPG